MAFQTRNVRNEYPQKETPRYSFGFSTKKFSSKSSGNKAINKIHPGNPSHARLSNTAVERESNRRNLRDMFTIYFGHSYFLFCGVAVQKQNLSFLIQVRPTMLNSRLPEDPVCFSESEALSDRYAYALQLSNRCAGFHRQ